MKSLKSFFIILSVILLSIYTGLCTYYYFMQDAILFHPTKLSEQAVYSFDFTFEERWFEPEQHVRIHAIHAKADSSKGLVYFFAGNGGINRSHPDKYQLFLKNGFDVIYPDYRGFGKSRGELFDQEDLVGDANYIYENMLQEYTEEQIILVGYSLGSGVAAQVAVLHDPAKLILWAPYYSIVDMKDAQLPFLPDALLRYPFRTNEALQKVKEPVYIFYAEEDQILPVDRSIHLRAYLKEGDAYYLLQGQRHGGIYRNKELIRQMRQLLKVN